MILLPAESLGRKQNHTDSLCRKPFFVDGTCSLGMGKKSRTVSAEAKYDGQSLQEAKISGLVYTLCSYKVKEPLCLPVCFRGHSTLTKMEFSLKDCYWMSEFSYL